MITRDGCPQCGSQRFKKNGHIHNGKQNHQCKACERQFVGQTDQRLIPDDQRALVERLLLERISLRGICRTVGVGLKWLLGFLNDCYTKAPENLNVHLPTQLDGVVLYRLEVEADETWSFVGKKANRQWIWIAIEANTGSALHVMLCPECLEKTPGYSTCYGAALARQHYLDPTTQSSRSRPPPLRGDTERHH